MSSPNRFEALADTLTPAMMREAALPVLERVANANARGVSHPDERGSPSMERLAFMLYAAAMALEEIKARSSPSPTPLQTGGK